MFGETARFHGTKRPSGFGLRAVVFHTFDAQMLARVALHEGAHLAGEGEEGAGRGGTQVHRKLKCLKGRQLDRREPDYPR